MKTTRDSLTRRRIAFRGVGLASITSVVLALAGCGTTPESHVVSAPPPSAAPVATAPATTTVVTPANSGSGSPSVQQAQVVVTQQPPVPQTETVLAQPSSKHVWIPGYWSYRDDRYVWIAGRWEIPPHTDAKWIAPRWEREANGYRYYEGYWE